MTKNTKKFKIANKLLGWFLLVALVPLITVGYVSYKNSATALKKEVINSLVVIAENKADHIIAFFEERKKDVTALIFDHHFAQSFEKFITAFKFGTDSSEYKAVDKQFRAEILHHKEVYGYYDIFLISPEGDIVFTATHEADFGTNLRTGHHKNTELAKAFHRSHTLLEMEISDFKRYAPSGNEPAAFITAPVIQEGKLLGILAIQLNTKEINELAQNFTGLGETGETIIASAMNNHALFLTPTRHDLAAAFNRKVLLGSKNALPIQQAISGKKGAGLYKDYLNQEVIAVWQYLPSLRWGIVVKINTDEAFIPIFDLAKLFLIVGFLTVFSVVIIAMFVSKTISRPIVKLTRATELIADGDLTVKMEIESNDEIGVLAQCFNHMITEREQAEIKLRLAKETAEKAKIEAEFANRAKSTFLANMSHELRTPLNGILGYTQILHRDKTLNTKQQEAINIIHRSGEYLLTLISDVLDLSKIEADRIELYPTDFHFENFLQSIVEIFEIRVKQKEISFIYEKLSHLPKGVHADEKRLRQIIINLLGNAIKFTKQGGVSFKVGYHNKKIRFQVEDTGVGIAPEELAFMFEPFRQVGDKNARAEGTGLGLSITKKLVEMMGSKLHVESTLGKGSTFWMALNLPEVSGFINPNTVEEPIIIGFEGKSLVLIVDDKQENRSVLVNLLAPLGFEVIEAVDGQDCINKTREHKPDLILTDLVMPIMDGFEATRQIRRIPKFKDVIIIMISASVFECHKQQSMDAGCDDFLPKPVRADDLLKLLENHLKLTWVYEEEETSETEGKNGEIEPEQETGKLVGPSKEQATILFDLAMKGNLKSVVKQLEEFEQSSSQLKSFANKIRALAKNFDEEQICDLIEQYLE
ncbi:ATP-binding protein [Candidatus Parabeggiatoa sp. HSG14]|uniref:ATP-binding protein n=1 Tax=Candidatus Parabeggiatoa sp. HSG14 TaxID=3055593 RepID=UPI0025A7E67B|nr:ATP-binding protein [Thiotrichales bacterium HSG14]